MRSVVIFEKGLEKLGRELMKDFYDHVYNDYLLKEFEGVKLKRKYYDENLTKDFLSLSKENMNYYGKLYIKNINHDDLFKMKTEELFSKIEDKIKNKTIDYNFVYDFFDKMDENLKINKDFDFEMDEDLFCMKKAFNKLYEVFHHNHIFLED